MSKRSRTSDEAPDVEPLDVDGVRTVAIFTVLWGVAFVVLALQRATLETNGTEWWLWTCLAGVGLGLLGLEYTRKRRDAIERTRLLAEADLDEGDLDDEAGVPENSSDPSAGAGPAAQASSQPLPVRKAGENADFSRPAAAEAVTRPVEPQPPGAGDSRSPGNTGQVTDHGLRPVTEQPMPRVKPRRPGLVGRPPRDGTSNVPVRPSPPQAPEPAPETQLPAPGPGVPPTAAGNKPAERLPSVGRGPAPADVQSWPVETPASDADTALPRVSDYSSDVDDVTYRPRRVAHPSPRPTTDPSDEDEPLIDTGLGGPRSRRSPEADVDDAAADDEYEDFYRGRRRRRSDSA